MLIASHLYGTPLGVLIIVVGAVAWYFLKDRNE
jgi:hypothetical protein